MIRNKKGTSGYNGVLVDNCKKILQREWFVEVQHICREANRVADWLANWARNKKLGSIY